MHGKRCVGRQHALHRQGQAVDVHEARTQALMAFDERAHGERHGVDSQGSLDLESDERSRRGARRSRSKLDLLR